MVAVSCIVIVSFSDFTVRVVPFFELVWFNYLLHVIFRGFCCEQADITIFS